MRFSIIKVILLVAVLAVVSVQMADAVPNPIGMLFKNRRVTTESLSDPSQLWFMNKVDHFNHQDTRLYKQRYFVNTTVWNKPSGPVFLQIGGEGPISSSYVQNLAMSSYAKLHGALQFAVEHRFYGLSYPLPTLATENLRLLSSQQALSDVAYFLEQVIPLYFPPGVKPLVVVFGCSYAGSLAGWFRLKYVQKKSSLFFPPLDLYVNYCFCLFF